MGKGYSIHIGLNHVDPAKYNGWDGALGGCIPDAKDMAAIAKAQGLQSQIMTDGQATSAAVLKVINDAANTLQPGDYLWLTYSGHGGQIRDTNADEADQKDETWVLFDRQVLDDELNAAYARFRSGVYVLVFSDSCHSGTVTRQMPGEESASEVSLAGSRMAPVAVCRENFEANEESYTEIQRTVQTRGAVRASVLLISGCQDNQLSGDMGSNGVFTYRVKQVWNNGAFQGDHGRFIEQIRAKMPVNQTPNEFWIPSKDTQFSKSRPFTVPSSIAGSLPQTLALKATINGKFVCAENAGSQPLVANRDAAKSWETFEVKVMGADRIALKSRANGKFVCAENAGSQPLIANRDVAYPGDAHGNGSWEIFQVKPMGPGRIALRATINGKFVCAESAGRSWLIANRDVAYPGDLNGNGSWEIFTYHAV